MWDWLHILVELVTERRSGGDVEARDLGLADVIQVHHQRAVREANRKLTTTKEVEKSKTNLPKTVSMSCDKNFLACLNLWHNFFLPVWQNSLARSLKRFGEGE